MENSFFITPFHEKRFVNVSICESNIKAKKGTYYGRVCKTGHLNTKQILQIVKDKAPYIDVPMVESALEKLADVILDMVGQGYSVDLSSLGTFSLSTQGKIEMNTEDLTEDVAEDVVNDEEQNYDTNEKIECKAGNYDVSEQVKNGVNFAFKFSPSKELKASMKNIKINLAVKKKNAPIIKTVEDALPERQEDAPQVIKLIGNNLKIAGDDERVGLYIEEKSDDVNIPSYMMKNIIKRIIKVPRSSLIQNENKTLTLLLDRRLKRGVQYSFTIITQSTIGGKVGKKLRRGSILTSLKL